MIPADLLSKLREADPDLWARATVPVADEISHCTRCDAWLQHCLQEAIRAGGWEYRIETTIERGISCFIGVPIHGGKFGAMSYGEMYYADTESEVLLRAYLAAIEEVKA